MTPKRRPFGIDFSGARSAGKTIWIAEGRLDGRNRVELVDCYPASALPDSGADRTLALAALRRLIASTPDGIFGCDFPVGLPQRVMRSPDWRDFIRGFGDLYSDASAFRADCRRIMSNKEIRRATDEHAETPMCAWNLRLFRQTYHGLADLLRPLHLAGEAAILPMESANPNFAWIVETCPASVLKKLGHYEEHKSYKAKSGLAKKAAARKERQFILEALVRSGRCAPPSRPIEAIILEDNGGDALDSAIACLAAASALRQLDGPISETDRIEGKVFFEL